MAKSGPVIISWKMLLRPILTLSLLFRLIWLTYFELDRVIGALSDPVEHLQLFNIDAHLDASAHHWLPLWRVYLHLRSWTGGLSQTGSSRLDLVQEMLRLWFTATLIYLDLHTLFVWLFQRVSRRSYLFARFLGSSQGLEAQLLARLGLLNIAFPDWGRILAFWFWLPRRLRWLLLLLLLFTHN